MSRYAIYDPLTAATTPAGHDQEITSYWRAHPQGKAFVIDPLAALPTRVHTLIIGAGYTGLNAAIELATQGVDDILVIDAGDIGAGCSSRNAGFVLPSSGRLSLADYRQRFGEEVAAGVLHEFNFGVTHLEDLVKRHAIDCDYAPANYLRIAHNADEAAKLRQLAAVDSPWPRTFIKAAELQHRLPGVRHGFAALQQQPAARVHPLALVQGYAKVAEQMGVAFKTHCPVLNIQSRAQSVHVETAQGPVSAERVLLCTNAYATRMLLTDVTSHQLPVLSNVAVTAPLSQWQIQQIGLGVNDLVMDTRRLKYYYRLLDDNRLLFGGRGAVSGQHARHPRYAKQLHRAMCDTMPVLNDTPFEYQWSGWVSVPLDAYPRVYRHSSRVLASLGYCGAGISFASLAGKRLAELAQGQSLADLPFYRSAPPSFPFASMRRTGQRLYYQYAKLRDRLG